MKVSVHNILKEKKLVDKSSYPKKLYLKLILVIMLVYLDVKQYLSKSIDKEMLHNSKERAEIKGSTRKIKKAKRYWNR